MYYTAPMADSAGGPPVPDLQNVTWDQVKRWTDDDCRGFLQSMRWPNGPICPRCGADRPYRINRRSRTKNIVTRLLKCRSCKRQFSATVGTVFQDSSIPLRKWFEAIYRMCNSESGINAHQLHRMLDIGYESAWFMCHRIREAMRDCPPG